MSDFAPQRSEDFAKKFPLAAAIRTGAIADPEVRARLSASYSITALAWLPRMGQVYVRADSGGWIIDTQQPLRGER